MRAHDELRRHGFLEVGEHELFVTGDPIDIRATMRSFELSGAVIIATTPAYHGSGLCFHGVRTELVRGVRPHLRNIAQRPIDVGAVRWCPVHIRSLVDGGLVQAIVVGPMAEMQLVNIEARLLR